MDTVTWEIYWGTADYVSRVHVWFEGYPPLEDETIDAYIDRVSRLMAIERALEKNKRKWWQFARR